MKNKTIGNPKQNGFYANFTEFDDGKNGYCLRLKTGNEDKHIAFVLSISDENIQTMVEGMNSQIVCFGNDITII